MVKDKDLMLPISETFQGRIQANNYIVNGYLDDPFL